MSKENFWEMTGAQKTYDTKTIDEIYKKAAEENEDDKFFLFLLKREYMAALDEAFVNVTEPKANEVINKLENIYSNINTRFCPQLWEEVFEAEIFKDYLMLVFMRNEIMGFLLSHEYLSKDIWRILDKHLHILRDIDSVKETVPDLFVQRVKSALTDEPLFDFERIRQVKATDKTLDEYIDGLLMLKDMVEYEQSDEEVFKHIKSLEAYGFYHIYYDVERMNYLVRVGKDDEEIERICGMLADEEGLYIRSCVGRALWYLGRSDDADNVWQGVLEQSPDYKMALLGHAGYLYENECYEQAKDCIFTILEKYGESDDVIKLLKNVNEVVMKNYIDMYEENPDDLYDGIQYAWCLCQNGQWDELIEFLLDMGDDESISYDFNMLLGRAYFSKEKYNMAVPYFQKWIKHMMLLPCDGSEEYEEKIERYPAALAIMAETYYEIGDMDKAVYFMEQSMHAYDDDDDERFKSMTRLADFYNEIGRYDEAYNIAARVVKEDDCNVWAYAAHQKAAFETYKISDTINDYFELANFVPNMAEPYVYAAKVYMYNSMYDEMETVLDRAAENGAYEPQLVSMRFIVSAGKAELSELDDIEAGYEKMLSSNPELKRYKDIDLRFYLTIENRYRRASDYDGAIEYIDKVIKKEPENNYHKWEKADLYFRKNDDAKALEIYDTIADELKDDNSFLCDYAFCMQYNDKWEESADILRKVLESEDTFMADAYMARYYKKLYNEKYLTQYYEKTKMHINRQIEKTPDNLFSIRERIVLLSMTENYDEYEMAIRDALFIIEENSDDEAVIRQRLAEMYMRKGDYEKAFEESNKVFGLEAGYYLHRDTYVLDTQIYERMNMRDVSEKLLKKAYRKSHDGYYLKIIGDCCLKNGDYRGAVKWYKKNADRSDEGYLSSALLAKAHLLNNSKISAGRIHKKIRENVSGDTAGALYDIAWQCFDILLDAEKAIEYMEAAVEYIDFLGPDAVYSSLALFYRYVNNDEKAKEFAGKLFEAITKEHDGSIEKYIDVKYGLLNRMDNVVLYYIGIGEFETAEDYINRMLEGKMCYWCNEPCCVDAYIRLAQIYIMQGDFDGMIKVCKTLSERALRNPQAHIYLGKIGELKKQYENYR